MTYIPNMAIFDASLERSDLWVLAYLAYRQYKNPMAWPSIPAMAGELRLSERTVQRALDRLEVGGYIKRVRPDRQGSGHITSYRVLKKDDTHDALFTEKDDICDTHKDDAHDTLSPQKGDTGVVRRVSPVSKTRGCIRKKSIIIENNTARELFEVVRKLYPGTKRGLETEFRDFIRKHTDWREVLPLLRPALESRIEDPHRPRASRAVGPTVEKPSHLAFPTMLGGNDLRGQGGSRIARSDQGRPTQANGRFRWFDAPGAIPEGPGGRGMRILDRLCDKPGEAAVLGSMLQDPHAALKVLEVLEREDFFLPEHKVVFDAIVSTWKLAPDYDGLMVRAALQNRGDLDRGPLAEAGGLGYLQRIMDSVPSSANVVYYAGQVKERSRYRQAVRAVEAMQKALESGESADAVIEQIQEQARSLDPMRQDGLWDVAAHAVEVAGGVRDQDSGLSTWFVSLDRIARRLCPGDLIILGARPSMGKTALALNIGLNLAKQGVSVGIASLETTGRKVTERFLHQLSGVSRDQILDDPLDPAVVRRWDKAASTLESLKITVAEGCVTVPQVHGFVRRMKHVGGLGLLILDHIQLMRAGGKRSRYEDLTEITGGLKDLAVREQIPVLALSQLSRAVEQRPDRLPRLSDLRESGSIEQDADQIWLLYRADYYRVRERAGERTDGLAQIDVAKNRDGPTGTAILIFDERNFRFGDYSQGLSHEYKEVG